MSRTLLNFYQLEDKKTKEIVDLGIKETINVKNNIKIIFHLQIMKRNQKSVEEQINLEKKTVIECTKRNSFPL